MIKADILHELLENYTNKLNACRDIVLTDEDRIEEIDRFLSSVEVRSEDYRFFSPFSTDELYDGKIEKYREEKAFLLAEINKLNDEIRDLNYYVEGLNNYIDALNVDSNLIESEDLDSTNNNIDYSEIKKCIDSLLLISSYILSDPMRAKSELLNCIDVLKCQL